MMRHNFKKHKNPHKTKFLTLIDKTATFVEKQ